jgi:hypothetical protein
LIKTNTFLDYKSENSQPANPVVWLFMSIPNDEDRRKHILGIWQEKLKDSEFRKME